MFSLLPPSSSHMTDVLSITLLRHARSRADDEGVHEGRYDSPLTDVGREQVRERAESFRRSGFKVDEVIASPLARARETAEIVAAAIGAPIELDPDWMEVDTGPLAGLTFAEAAKRFPTPAFRNPYEIVHGAGESDWELHCRAIRATERVVRRGPGAYLVVAHGGVLNAAVRCMLGVPLAINLKHGAWFAFGDVGFARLRYRPGEHAWILDEFNPGAVA